MKNIDAILAVKHSILISREKFNEIKNNQHLSWPETKAAIASYFDITVIGIDNAFASSGPVSITYEENTSAVRPKYLLVTTDGYNLDDHTFYDSFESAQTAMKDSYKALTPDDWIEDFSDMSHCGDDDAILYDNGNNVYVWSIIAIPA